MPKKHRQSYLGTKPNYVHPTLSGGKQDPSQSSPSTSTVNERLSQLRIAQASPESADRTRALAELLNQKSLPPSLGQGILGLAPTVAPRPRQNVRFRIPLRTPGPAPPPSWQNATTQSRQIDGTRYRRAPIAARSFGKKAGVERRRPEQLARFLALMGESRIDERSLLHASLRTAAENWEAIAEDCLEELEVLPVHLRSALLSYLTKFGPASGVDIRSVQALFPAETDAKCLDFSGLIGWSLSLKELKRWLKAPIATPVDPAEQTQIKSDDLAEFWDEEEVTDKIWAPLAPALTTRLPFLTKLSLAFPPSQISWGDLLSLSKDLGTLTHLSLAHWPIPTRTPNMQTASYISKTGSEHAAGGMSLYSASDKEFDESAIILRQLSENTYCLRWLDLEGCSAWLPALAWQGVSQRETLTAATATATAEWSQRSHSGANIQGPDWRGAWRNIAYLSLSQDWVPQDRQFLGSAAFKGRIAQRFYTLSPTHLQIIQDIKESTGQDQSLSQCQTCLSKRNGSGDGRCGVCTAHYDYETAKIARWLEREADAWAVGRSVNLSRAGSGNARCEFDHGWQKKITYFVQNAQT